MSSTKKFTEAARIVLIDPSDIIGYGAIRLVRLRGLKKARYEISLFWV
jgi:hypothetical protein